MKILFILVFYERETLLRLKKKVSQPAEHSLRCQAAELNSERACKLLLQLLKKLIKDV